MSDTSNRGIASAVTLLLLSLAGLLAADPSKSHSPSQVESQGKQSAIRCKIDGQEVVFESHARAIASTEGRFRLEIVEEASKKTTRSP